MIRTSNSLDPDETPSYSVAHLDLNCLHRLSDISAANNQRVNKSAESHFCKVKDKVSSKNHINVAIFNVMWLLIGKKLSVENQNIVSLYEIHTEIRCSGF